MIRAFGRLPEPELVLDAKSGFAHLVVRPPSLEELLAEVARIRRTMPALQGPRTPVDDWRYPRRTWRP